MDSNSCNRLPLKEPPRKFYQLLMKKGFWQRLKNNRGNCTVNINTDKHSITPEYKTYGMQIA